MIGSRGRGCTVAPAEDVATGLAAVSGAAAGDAAPGKGRTCRSAEAAPCTGGAGGVATGGSAAGACGRFCGTSEPPNTPADGRAGGAAGVGVERLCADVCAGPGSGGFGGVSGLKPAGGPGWRAG